MDVEVNVREKILKPVSEVFAAVVEPAKMAKYFISSASAPLVAGTTVEWEFADVGAKVSIDVLEVEPERRIVLEGQLGPSRSRMTLAFTAEANGTVLTINERPFALDEEGVKRALGQTAGWTYFLACLKAYLHFGVDLRAGLDKRLTDV